MAQTKTLFIVESPNKVKKISSYLGKNYIVRASYGHIMDLSTGDSKNRLGIDLKNDYAPKYKLIQEKKDKISAIIDATSEVDRIYIATDPDREGEAIAWHLYFALESAGKPIKRVTFNEITKAAIQKAIKKPTDLDKNLYDAQQARRVVDRIVGFLGSDFLRNSFDENLSAGRVQSVAVELIVDRDNEISAFNKEEYWNINSILDVNGEELNLKLCSKVTNKEDAEAMRDSLNSSSFHITNVDSSKKNKRPPPPLTTSSLQQLASSAINFSVKKTMTAAQSLYEIGLITYLRTDSTRIAPEAITAVRDWLNNNNHAVPQTPNIFATKGSAQDAHECIRPTDVLKLPQNIFVDDEQRKLYRLIWERFVACQMEDAVYDTVSITAKTNFGETLKANGKILSQAGYLAILTNADKDTVLPNVKVGDSFTAKNTLIDQKFTQPPSRYTEALLVRELEKRGIGRPSTYADTIDRIKGRDYVEIVGKTYRSTELGQKVIKQLRKYYSFMDYTYTAEMESKLDLVADGKLSYVQMIDDFFLPFQQECKRAELDSLPDYGFTCNVCGSRMFLRHGRFGYYMACVDRPNCNGTYSVDMVDGKPIKKKDFEFEVVEGYHCPKCNGRIFKVQGKFGPYGICENKPRCDGKITRLPVGEKCPKCGKDLYLTVLRDVPTLSCVTYPNCDYAAVAPDGMLPGWVNPATLQEKTTNKKVRKVLDFKKEK